MNWNTLPGRTAGFSGDPVDRLRRQARKVTGPRRSILRVLSRQSHPVSAKEVQAALRGECDLATVYRALHLLEKLQLVQRYDFADRVARYELLKEGDDGHHHHLICTSCAGIVEIGECFIHELEKRLATRNGFRSVTHKLEFYGVCPRCQ